MFENEPLNLLVIEIDTISQEQIIQLKEIQKQNQEQTNNNIPPEDIQLT